MLPKSRKSLASLMAHGRFHPPLAPTVPAVARSRRLLFYFLSPAGAMTDAVEWATMKAGQGVSPGKAPARLLVGAVACFLWVIKMPSSQNYEAGALISQAVKGAYMVPWQKAPCVQDLPRARSTSRWMEGIVGPVACGCGSKPCTHLYPW